MPTEKELTLIRFLRMNSRMNLSDISKETKIPISTICDVLRKMQTKKMLRHTSLIDFSSIGYKIRVFYAMSTDQREILQKILMEHPNVNSLSSLADGYDFYAEAVFKDMKEVMLFRDMLEKNGVNRLEQHFLLDELKKESFIP